MRRVRVLLGVGAAAVAGACAGADHSLVGPATSDAGSIQADRLGGGAAQVFGRYHRLMIADQFNNRVIEVDRHGEILWHFGRGPNDIGPTSIIGVNDAQPVGRDLVLMAGTGAPPGTEPLCPNGCADNRVILVDEDGRIVWQYGSFGVTGAGPDQLSSPVQATFLPNRHVLITDQGNARIIEVNRHHEIVWQYGTTGVTGLGFNQLNNPNSAELLENGHILIADENNNRAIEVTRDHDIVATFTAGGSVSGVAFASRLENGHTLITDSNNNRIVEVDAHDQIVWQYVTNTQPGSNAAPLPTRAVRLATGATLISDQFNDRVIAVNHAGKILLTFGHLNQPGFGTDNATQGLNAPYDAKVVGDFTGLTAPFRDGDRDGDDPRDGDDSH
jgi:outer membrane protein assembly factor BamB